MFKSLKPFQWLFVIAIFLSCNNETKQDTATETELNVVTVGMKTIPFYTEYVGETYGREDIGIQSRVDGWITGIHFKEGDFVTKGQLLYTIDDLPYKNKIDQAEAKLAQANTQKTRTKSDLERVEPLAAMHALSARDLDAAKASYEASNSEVDAAAAALRNAKIELSYTRITAPISGIIGISKFLVGDYVGKLNVGTPLNTISSVDNIRVRFSISEDEYLKFARQRVSEDHKILGKSLPVQLILSDGTLYDETGLIDLTNRQIDPATGSLLIQAVFPNSNKLLRPGQYVKIKLQTGFFKDAILIPQQAMNQVQNIFQVFLLSDSNKIVPTIIKPGVKVGSNLIVTSGLKVNDRLAVIGNAVVMKPNVIIKAVPMKWNYDSTSVQ